MPDSGTAFRFLFLRGVWICMTNILLCGDAADTSILDALIPALKFYGGLCYSGRNAVMQYGTTAEYFLFESDGVPKIGLGKGILLLKDKLNETMPAPVPDGFICVLGSRNEQAAHLLCESKATVVTCGMGSKDTLSLAGLDAAAACVSLQRNMATLGGKLLEPHDFNVKLLQQRSPEQILAVSAVLLLSGIDSEQEYRI